MARIESSRTRIAIIAIALAIGALAYAIVKDSAAREGTAPPTAAEREAVEAEIFRAKIIPKLKGALGDDFAGVWFEPSTLQLHVGVISPGSRQDAEAVAEEAGLDENITEAAARFTWRELDQAQSRWNLRLADLFARGEVMTSLASDVNAVKIILSETVDASRRAAVEDAAAADEVAVSVSIEPASAFNIQPLAEQCGVFKTEEAYCDPPFVSGVSTRSKLIGGQPERCSAGPLVVREDRSTAATATETFMVTAGHCIANGGGNAEPWFSKNNAKTKEEELGKAFEHRLAGTGGADVGVIRIDNNYWTTKQDPPIPPSHAEWNGTKETKPVPITEAQNPSKGVKVCFAAQRTGENCGTVLEDNMTHTLLNGEMIEGVAKVNLETKDAKPGDSGAPMFPKAEKGIVQGYLVAGTLTPETEEANPVYAQRWFVAMFELKTNFELLKTENEKRHKGGIGIGADHVVLTTSSNSMQKFTLMPGGTTFECTSLSIDNATIQNQWTAVEKIEFEPTLSKCENLLGQEVSFKANGCKYVLHLASEKTSGTTDIECPAGKSMEYSIGLNCKYIVGTQTGLGTVSYKNTGSGSTQEIVVEPNVTGIVSYTTLGECIWCPVSSKEGTYTGNFTLTGEDSEGAHVGVFVG